MMISDDEYVCVFVMMLMLMMLMSVCVRISFSGRFWLTRSDRGARKRGQAGEYCHLGGPCGERETAAFYRMWNSVCGDLCQSNHKKGEWDMTRIIQLIDSFEFSYLYPGWFTTEELFKFTMICLSYLYPEWFTTKELFMFSMIRFHRVIYSRLIYSQKYWNSEIIYFCCWLKSFEFDILIWWILYLQVFIWIRIYMS